MLELYCLMNLRQPFINMTTKICFVGLGKFGLPIALNLQKKGLSISALIINDHNLTQSEILESKGGI